MIRLESVDGISNASTWRFSPTDGGHTEMSVEFDYTLPGGLLGAALATIVGTAITHTEFVLRARTEELPRSSRRD